MWLNKLKIALIQKDIPTIEILITTMPRFSHIDEMKEASYLLREASSLLTTLQDDTANSMIQLKKNSHFLRSTQTEIPSTLDITL